MVDKERFNICAVVLDICPVVDNSNGHCEAMVPPERIQVRRLYLTANQRQSETPNDLSEIIKETFGWVFLNSKYQIKSGQVLFARHQQATTKQINTTSSNMPKS